MLIKESIKTLEELYLDAFERFCNTKKSKWNEVDCRLEKKISFKDLRFQYKKITLPHTEKPENYCVVYIYPLLVDETKWNLMSYEEQNKLWELVGVKKPNNTKTCFVCLYFYNEKITIKEFWESL